MSDFKTVYPGQYSPREKKILDETRKKLQEQIGKPTMFPVTPADPTLMRLYANAWDPWNPLFNDDEYAKNTKYGSIIAIPCWKEPGAMFPMLPMDFGDKLQLGFGHAALFQPLQHIAVCILDPGAEGRRNPRLRPGSRIIQQHLLQQAPGTVGILIGGPADAAVVCKIRQGVILILIDRDLVLLQKAAQILVDGLQLMKGQLLGLLPGPTAAIFLM